MSTKFSNNKTRLLSKKGVVSFNIFVAFDGGRSAVCGAQKQKNDLSVIYSDEIHFLFVRQCKALTQRIDFCYYSRVCTLAQKIRIEKAKL